MSWSYLYSPLTGRLHSDVFTLVLGSCTNKSQLTCIYRDDRIVDVYRGGGKNNTFVTYVETRRKQHGLMSTGWLDAYEEAVELRDSIKHKIQVWW